ncbi:helical backbone metal receptor [Pusillimonas sp. MFBS29]|uniref:heme/hemin ABC transporter substrate-binding protein n=1 Tax=Pusillimonas sp. MFBS29 TaxID=2886690 RepID=UPI001D11E91D|nr:helical backbone metal receptor [Pusillimonas sp. MFBS29]MCC2595049.1 helical backbone metal receptor [Pusillimonas sp. MFBS29]
MFRCLLAACLMLPGLVWGGQTAPARVVSLGGSVTEIIYALGRGDVLVASDASSLYPKAATVLPQIGYYRAVPIEGVVAQSPDLVLASEHAGPPQALARLDELGVRVKTVTDKPALDSLYQRIGLVAQALMVPNAGRSLVQQVRRDVAAAQATAAPSRRALVLVNRSGPLMAAGQNTAANAILELAGLSNAFSDQTGYKPVSAEGLAMLEPELIIITEASLQASGGMEKLRASAGIASTPAAKRGRMLVMDDLLIQGIGPRVALAIEQLKDAAR